ncbi:MAG TPA: alpha/beta hydrolase [Anaerolineales bacterium]|nr:alpha/beta hydrolase [Anaerolineales bacterium]
MNIWNRFVRTLFAFVIAASLCLSWAAAPAKAAPPKPKVTWSPCYQQFGLPFECGTVQVPLDYDDPGVGSISIALIRLPASDPSQRIGSLFFNPGGPGGSGVDFILFAAAVFPEEMRAHFDMVGFDPRGIARSTALRCFGTPRQWGPIFTPFAFPTTPEEEAAWEAADRFLVGECEQRAGHIIDHMSTADVARDLDLLRQAVGDEKLNYVGYSYGSYLGVTYANLFPNNFRALVVDGVLDPIAWATGLPGQEDLPFSTRLRSDAGAIATLQEFFRLCDEGGPNCAFAPDSASRFDALAEKIKAEPVLITFPDGSILYINYSFLIANALGAMYNSFSWQSFAEFLAFLEAEASATTLAAKLQAFWASQGFITKRGFPNYPNFVEGFPGVACSDTDNPDTYAAWSQAAKDAESQFGYFGPLWTWITSICATWPGSQADRYAGPFTATTANPVLVTSTLFDPATRYEGAVTVAGLLPNSRLLTVNGWGHTTPFLSQCADLAVLNYLLTGELPPEGTVCNQDWVPFTAPSTVTNTGAAGRARLLPALVPDVLRPPAK